MSNKMIPFGWREKGIGLGKLTALYVQEVDSNSDDDLQSLEISYQSAGAGGFFVIKTERWAFDSISEIVEVLEDFKAKIREEKR